MPRSFRRLLALLMLGAMGTGVRAANTPQTPVARAETGSPDASWFRRRASSPMLARPPATGILHLADVSADDLIAGRATVTFASDVSAASARARIAAIGYAIGATVPALNVFDVALPAGESVEAGLGALAALPGALRAEPETRMHADFHPNDPLYDSLQRYLPLIHAEQAWDIQQGDPRIITAVIDSGVDVTHPDLAGQIWKNPNPGTTGCPNDVNGCNFEDPANVDESCTPLIDPSGLPPPNGDIAPDIGGLGFHGTLVAGIIGAGTNNSIGMAGVVPHASILPVRVGDCVAPASPAIANGILYAVANGASVINLSIGGSCLGTQSYILDAIARAQNAGVVVVAAAGNSGRPCVESPASFDGVIAVGATNVAGTGRAPFSNWGSEISVVAPGTRILGTIPHRNADPPNDYYMRADGTSFAAPIVAGLADLILSQNSLLPPWMVKDLIERGAVPLVDTEEPGWAGAGRVDLAQSLRLVPAGYYGSASVGSRSVADGTTVEATVGRQLCGQGSTYTSSGRSYYLVFVSASFAQTGCGTAGAIVNFTVGGRAAGSSPWRAASMALDLNGGLAAQASPAPAPVRPAILYRAGWNLVAGPAGTVFKGSGGALYTLQPGNAGYHVLPVDASSRAGFGYWAYFSADTSVLLAPDGDLTYAIQLPPGRPVMIGNPTGTRAVTVTGADSVLVFDPRANGYVQTQSLQPGQGAWALVRSGGQIQIR